MTRALGAAAVALLVFALFLVAFLVAPLVVLAVFALSLLSAEGARRRLRR